MTRPNRLKASSGRAIYHAMNRTVIPFPTKTGPLLRKGGSYRINYGKVWKSK